MREGEVATCPSGGGDTAPGGGMGAKSGWGFKRRKREGPLVRGRPVRLLVLPGAGERTGAVAEACLECRPLSPNCLQQ